MKPTSESTPAWVEVCGIDEIEREDVIRFDHDERTFAVYRSPEDIYYATDGLCTHEQVHLADGLVLGHLIECPRHNGCFDYRTGEAMGAPVCIDLCVYPTKLDESKILVQIGSGPP